MLSKRHDAMWPLARAARVGLSATLVATLVLAGPALVTSTAGTSGFGVYPAAHALGEDGPFDIPLGEGSTQRARLGEAARFDLTRLLSTQDLETLALTTGRLGTPEGDADAGARPQVTRLDDGKELRIDGEGVWTYDAGVVTFSPASGAKRAQYQATLTIMSTAGNESRPLTLTALYPSAPTMTVRAAEGVPVTVDLGLDPLLVDPSTTKFTLDRMPPGTILNTERTRLVVPDQGTWTVTDGGNALTFEPRRERMGTQPIPVRYTVTSLGSLDVAPGAVTLKMPVISSLERTKAYGQKVEFDLAKASNNVQLASLELVPYGGAETMKLSRGGTVLDVANQGQWTLDRSNGVLTFQPKSDKVRDVTPVGVRGKDVNGNESATSRMSVAYPEVESHDIAFAWGTPAVFAPLEGARYVQPDTFTFTTEGLPDNARISGSGSVLTVPDQGTWTYDETAGSVTFTPVKSMDTSPSPVTFVIRDIYSVNSTSGVLDADYAAAVPTSRDDEAVSNSQVLPTTVDVLANDTPAASNQPFDPSSIRLRSSSATNIQELVGGSGTRLVIPDEGTFTVTNSGSVRFTPVPTFVGRTKPVSYSVEDSAGLRSSASIVVEIDPAVASPTDSRGSGVNSLLGRLMPSEAASFSMFASITALLMFTGIVAAWVGRQIDRGRTES